jgi:phenylacetate-CoA ligase
MQIEQVLMGFPEVGENYVIELVSEDFIDQLTVKVEIRDGYFVEDMRVLTGLQKAIVRQLRDEILVTPRVDLVQTGSLPKSEGKAVRVIDRRGKE